MVNSQISPKNNDFCKSLLDTINSCGRLSSFINPKLSFNILQKKHTSLVYRFDIIEGQNSLSVIGKFHEGASKEFDEMKKIWDFHYKTKKNYRIPEPYGIIENYSGFLMENIEDINIFKNHMIRDLVVFNSFFKIKKLKSRIRICVDWLHDFEQMIPKNDSPISDILEETISKLKSLSFIDKKTKNEVESFILQRSSHSQTTSKFFLNHDFKPHNISINDNQATVIDWAMAGLGYNFTMVYSFLRPFYTMRRYPFYSKRHLVTCSNYFIKKYLQDTIIESSSFFDFFGVIYEIDYLSKKKFSSDLSWNNRMQRDISISKILDFIK